MFSFSPWYLIQNNGPIMVIHRGVVAVNGKCILWKPFNKSAFYHYYGIDMDMYPTDIHISR